MKEKCWECGTMVRIVAILWKRFSQHKLPDLAAQLSFYFLLSLFPFLLFSLSLLAYLPISSDLVLSMISQYVPSVALPFVETNIRRLLDIQRPELLSVSLLLALWAASNGSHAVIRSLNKAYDVEQERPFIKGRLVALGLVGGLFLLFLVALLLPVFGRIIGLWVAGWVGLSEPFIQRWETVRWLLSMTMTTVLFIYVYILAPNTPLAIKDVWPGAILAAIGWQGVSFGFSYYVEHFGRFSVMYGGIGGIVIFMLWLYLTGMVLLIGGEFNSTLKLMRSENMFPDK